MDLTALTPVVALLGCAGTCVATISTVRQAVKDLKEYAVENEKRHEKTHQTLFSKIDSEAEKREAEDKDIRKNYVPREHCVLMQCAVPAKARGAHGD